MKVRALVSFVSNLNGQKYRVQQKQVVEMPKGADWLRAGFVEPVEEPKRPVIRKRSKR